jgi:hypothetical protein
VRRAKLRVLGEDISSPEHMSVAPLGLALDGFDELEDSTRPLALTHAGPAREGSECQRLSLAPTLVEPIGRLP